MLRDGILVDGGRCYYRGIVDVFRYFMTPIGRVWKLYHSLSTTTFQRCVRRISTVACAVFYKAGVFQIHLGLRIQGVEA